MYVTHMSPLLIALPLVGIADRCWQNHSLPLNLETVSASQSLLACSVCPTAYIRDPRPREVKWPSWEPLGLWSSRYRGLAGR